MEHLWKMGYSAEDLISNIFRVCKNLPIEETLKLHFVKVRCNKFCLLVNYVVHVKFIFILNKCFLVTLMKLFSSFISGNWNNTSWDSRWN